VVHHQHRIIYAANPIEARLVGKLRVGQLHRCWRRYNIGRELGGSQHVAELNVGDSVGKDIRIHPRHTAHDDVVLVAQHRDSEVLIRKSRHLARDPQLPPLLSTVGRPRYWPTPKPMPEEVVLLPVSTVGFSIAANISRVPTRGFSKFSSHSNKSPTVEYIPSFPTTPPSTCAARQPLALLMYHTPDSGPASANRHVRACASCRAV
jgi:hypothetical protein